MEIKKTFLFSFIFLFLPLATFANVFPNDAISTFTTITGTTTTTIVSGTTPKTILGVQMMQTNISSNTYLRCGNTRIFYNTGTTTPMIFLNYVCNDTINVDKTGQDTADVVMTYVNYDIRTATTPIFTTGDLMIALLLFIGLILALIAFLQKGISSVSVVRDYQGNNSPDGKEFYKL